jgi:hypothetical protein
VELAVVLAQIALFALIEAITPMPFLKNQTNIGGWVVCGVLTLLALAALAVAKPLPSAAGPTGTPRRGQGIDGLAIIPSHPEPGDAVAFLGPPTALRRFAFLRRPADNTHLYLFLLIVSLLFTSMAIYLGLRLEVRNQLLAGVGLQASFNEQGAQGVVTLGVSASQLAPQDYVVVHVYGLESRVHIATICEEAGPRVDPRSCEQDPCYYFGRYCPDLVLMDVPVDSSGDVDRHLTFPFSTASYQRLHIETYTCLRAVGSSHCNETGQEQYNLTDIAVPRSQG